MFASAKLSYFPVFDRPWRKVTIVVTLLAAILIARVSWLSGAISLLHAGVSAVAFGATLTWLLRRFNRDVIFSKRLDDPRTRDAALQELDERLRELSNITEPNKYAVRANAAALALMRIDDPQRAVALLAPIDREQLHTSNAQLTVNHLIVAQLEAGEIDGARETAAAVALDDQPATPMRSVLASAVALVEAVDSRPEQAMRTMRLATDAPVSHESDLVLVHVHASRSEHDALQAALARLQAKPDGEAQLLKVAKHAGPASAAARALLEQSGAYR